MVAAGAIQFASDFGHCAWRNASASGVSYGAVYGVQPAGFCDSDRKVGQILKA